MTLDKHLRAKFYHDWKKDGLETAKSLLSESGINADEITSLSICPVHGTPLHIGKASISYGRPSAETLRKMHVEEENLPYKHTFQLGGCVRSKDSPRTVMVICCRDCRAAGSWWRSWVRKVLRRT